MLLIRTLIIGLAGGAAAFLAGMPAPWLSGSLAATLIAVAAGLRLQLPEWLRKAAFILLGLQTGLSVTPETVERAQHWPASLVILAVTVVVVVYACVLLLQRQFGWSRSTALFSSLPGALSLVLLLAESSTAEMRKVVVSQCVRLIILVVALPMFIQFGLAPQLGFIPPAMSNPGQIMLVTALAALGGLLLDRLKVPAGLIMGACLASATLMLTGLAAGTMPNLLLIPANGVLGIMIAMRLIGTSRDDLRQAALAGFSSFLLALAIAAAGAILTSHVTGLSLALTLLAFAPGGLEAMTIMAFALGLDPAYVALHQVARYIGLVLLMPSVTRLMLRHEVQDRGAGATPKLVENGD